MFNRKEQRLLEAFNNKSDLTVANTAVDMHGLPVGLSETVSEEQKVEGFGARHNQAQQEYTALRHKGLLPN